MTDGLQTKANCCEELYWWVVVLRLEQNGARWVGLGWVQFTLAKDASI